MRQGKVIFLVGRARPRRRRTSAWRRELFWLVVVAGVFVAAATYGVPQVSRDLAGGTSAPVVATTPAGILTARVTKIIDGDGLVLASGQEIRLGDFDAPEWNQPGGEEARRALTEIAYGKTVACTPCEGARRAGRCMSYDRLIATCRLRGERLGDLMRARGVREGGR